MAEFLSRNGRTGQELHRREYVEGAKRPGMRTQRTKLQSALLEHVKPGTLELSKKIVSIKKGEDVEDGVKLRFKDGTVDTADLVVGADGIRSVRHPELALQTGD